MGFSSNRAIVAKAERWCGSFGDFSWFILKKEFFYKKFLFEFETGVILLSMNDKNKSNGFLFGIYIEEMIDEDFGHRR